MNLIEPTVYLDIFNGILWHGTSRILKTLQVAPLGQPWARCARVLGLGTQAQQVQRPVKFALWANSQTNWRKLLLFSKRGKWISEWWWWWWWSSSWSYRDHDKLIDYAVGSNCSLFFYFPPWWCQPKPSNLTAGTEGELFKTRLSCNCSRNQERLSRQEAVWLCFSMFGPSEIFLVTRCSCLAGL